LRTPKDTISKSNPTKKKKEWKQGGSRVEEAKKRRIQRSHQMNPEEEVLSTVAENNSLVFDSIRVHYVAVSVPKYL
jgi:hypothetical protein